MNKQTKYIMPTDEEDAAINAGIAADPDTFELGDDFFNNAVRSEATTARGIADDVLRQVRGRQKSPTKRVTSIRLPDNVIDFFKAGGKDGKGWQTRLSNALEAYVKEHKAG